MSEALRVTPVDGTDDLGRPPAKVGLDNSAIMWTGLEHVPECASLNVIHDEAEVCIGLIRAQEVRNPWGVCPKSSKKQIALELRAALLEKWLNYQ